MNNEQIFESFYELQEALYLKASAKEERYNEYYHNMTIVNANAKSSYNIDYSNLKYFSDFGSSAMQKVLYNKTIAKQEDLVATFFTITLPSKYHYFITAKRIYNHNNRRYETQKLEFEDWEVNPNYAFNTMEEGIENGYKALSTFWRLFYNKIKTGDRRYKTLAKNLRYDLISEFHKTLQIHTHGIIYANEALLPYIKQCFNATIKELGFNRNGCDIKQDFVNNDGATQYILKYTTKFLRSDADQESHFYEMQKKSHADFMVGWKSILGRYSRIHKSSNTKLGIGIYKKIYRNLSQEDKELLLARALKNNTCLLYEIEQESFKVTTTIDKDTGEIKTKQLNAHLHTPMFHIEIEQSKERIPKEELLKDLLHQKSIYLKNSAPMEVVDALEKEIESLQSTPTLYRYTIHSLVIKDASQQKLYDKSWFSAWYEADEEELEEEF